MATQHYIGIAEPRAANWSISFPAFPGTVTTGQDLGELMANARDALASVVGAMVEDGERLPPSVEALPEQGDIDTAGYQNPHVVLVPLAADAADRVAG